MIYISFDHILVQDELSFSNMCNLNFMQLGKADPNSC